MEEPIPIPPVPEDAEPRYCPVCGNRVADLATTCLMCGTRLDVEVEEPEQEEEPRPRRQIPWGSLIAGVLTALAFLAIVGWLVRAQIVGPAGTPTPVVTATETLAPSSTPEPTLTPSITPTFTPIPPRVHQVQTGETCVSIATQYGISLDVLVALNAEKCGPTGIIRPNDLLLIPAATPTVGPSPTVGPGTPLPTPECPILHVVQAGQTGIGIADQYGISLVLLATANPQADLDRLQVNQVLQIPCGTPVPTATPTPDPNATATPIPKYPAPALLSPPDGATVTGSMVPLQWTAVTLLREDEQYAVRLRRLDEDLPVETILTRTTLVRLGEAYAPEGDAVVYEYSWQVTVVRVLGAGPTGEPRYGAASHVSEQRDFRWVAAPADGTPATPDAP